MTPRALLLLVIPLLLATPARAADDFERDRDRDLAVLRARDGSPGEIMAAARRLAERPRDDRWPDVIAALAGQALNGPDDVVRKTAHDALARVVGDGDAARRFLAQLAPAGERAGPDGAALPPEVRAAINLARLTSGEEQRRAAEALLEPDLAPAPRDMNVQFLQGEPLDGGTPLTPLIRAAADLRERNPDRAGRARDALTAILGPAEAEVAIRVGPLDPADTFYYASGRIFVHGTGGPGPHDLAVKLATSSRPDFRALALRMLRQEVEFTRADASPGARKLRAENKPLVDALSQSIDLDAVLAAASASAAARHPEFRQMIARRWDLADRRDPPGPAAAALDRQMIENARRNADYTATTIRACLQRLDDPDAALRATAHAYWETMLAPNGLVIDAASRPLAESIPECPRAVLPRVLSYFAKGDANLRTYLERQLVLRALRTKEDPIPAPRELWPDGWPPLVTAARAVHDTPDRYRLSLLQWFEQAAGRRPDAAGAELLPLLASDDAEFARAVARIASLAPDALGVNEALLRAIARGTVLPRDVTILAGRRAKLAGHWVARQIADRDGPGRLAALQILAALGAGDDAETRAALTRLLTTAPPDQRRLAAEALGTEDAFRLARAADLLRELRSPAPDVRVRAAHEAQRLALDAPAVMAALVRAVDSGDMPAREGLTLALERALATGQPAATVLAAADAEPQPTPRAYLRAARRAVTAAATAPK